LTLGGTTNITVQVTAQDGTQKTYTIAVTRLANDALLSNMNSSISPLTPSFASGINNYTLSVPNSTSTMTVAPVTDDPLATMTLNGNTFTSGSTSSPIALTA